MRFIRSRWAWVSFLVIVPASIALIAHLRTPPIVGTWVDKLNDPSVSATFERNGTYALHFSIISGQQADVRGHYTFSGDRLTLSDGIQNAPTGSKSKPAVFKCTFHGDEVTAEFDPPSIFAVVLHRK